MAKGVFPVVHVALFQILADVVFTDPISAPHAHRRKLARVHEPIDSHVRNPEVTRDLSHGQELADQGGLCRRRIGGRGHRRGV
jgi:hypothetical protein